MLLLTICLLAFSCVGQQIRQKHADKEECLSDETKVCEDECIGVATNCILNCANDENPTSCESECRREVFFCFDECPCHVNCPNGCPCPSYDCGEGTANDTVLVLGRTDLNDPPVMFSISTGNMREVAHFQYKEGTGNHDSCSTLFKGQMMVFGGSTESHLDQISVVEDCAVKRVGTLPMAFGIGGCNVFEIDAGLEEVLLCFGSAGKGACKSFDGSVIRERSNATYLHSMTSLGVYHASPFVVGGCCGNVHTEVLWDNEWQVLSDFGGQFTRSIYGYSFVTVDDGVILFGGEINEHGYKTTDGAHLFSGSWIELPKMKKGRRGHRSLRIDQNRFIHVGGSDGTIYGGGNLKFEEWDLTGDDLAIVESEASLTKYWYYSESFLVSSDFCY